MSLDESLKEEAPRQPRLRSRLALGLVLSWVAGGPFGALPSGALAPGDPTATTPEGSLHLESPPGQPDLLTATVRGLDPEGLRKLSTASEGTAAGSSLLSVYAWEQDPRAATEEGPPPGLGPLLGTWSIDGGELRFRPRFPLAPGLKVLALFRGSAWDKLTGNQGTLDLVVHGAVPTLDRPATTRVKAVFPSSPNLPSNLLRFYVHFSAPMSARHVLPHIRLFNEHGHEVQTAFVDVEGGLWDPQRTRLTLLVHPGRVKRGVGPNLALGPVLEEGRRYRLEISAGARDAVGLPLGAGFVKVFSVGPADYKGPDPAAWTLTPPSFPTEPLIVILASPADHALLQRLLAVENAAGEPVPGSIRVGQEEGSWQYLPESPWQPGEYFLVTSAALEDPSGNRLDRPFETARNTAPSETRQVRIPWTTSSITATSP